MLGILIRTIKRFAVLLPALVVGYISIFNIFPLLDKRLPIFLAAIVTYVIGAYLLVPAIIRLFRQFFPPRHVPSYCITADGFASDPINVALIGTQQQLRQAMVGAGWYEADHITLKTALRTALSTVYRWTYNTAPMSHLYLFGRPQDLGFQLPIKDAAAGSRHHVRFWATTYEQGALLNVHTIDWRERKEQLSDERLLWVGAASRDIGVAFIRHNAQLTHLVDPDTDSERELLVKHLVHSKATATLETVMIREPYRLKNVHSWRGHLHTDGQMAVLELKG